MKTEEDMYYMYVTLFFPGVLVIGYMIWCVVVVLLFGCT